MGAARVSGPAEAGGFDTARPGRQGDIRSGRRNRRLDRTKEQPGAWCSKLLATEEVLPLYAVSNDLGSIWLRWVVLADQAPSAGNSGGAAAKPALRVCRRFAPDDIAHNLSLAPWVQVCMARRGHLWGSASVDYPRESRDHRVEQPTS